jgi:ribA/ribD-fused uncharacterized protein
MNNNLLDPLPRGIFCFKGDWAFLSNFFKHPVEFEGITYPSSEHAFVAAKTGSKLLKEFISRIPEPGPCKQFGRALELRENWEELRVGIMREILRKKFAKGTPLAERLDATGDLELVEGNWWGDTFWGVCKGKGENNLGKLLMEIREENRGDLNV